MSDLNKESTKDIVERAESLLGFLGENAVTVAYFDMIERLKYLDSKESLRTVSHCTPEERAMLDKIKGGDSVIQLMVKTLRLVDFFPSREILIDESRETLKEYDIFSKEFNLPKITEGHKALGSDDETFNLPEVT